MPPLQLSLTSTAASKMKKALGLRSSTSSLGLKRGGNSPKADGSLMSKPLTVGELLRVQMRVPETVDSRIRRAFLRVTATQYKYAVRQNVSKNNSYSANASMKKLIRDEISKESSHKQRSPSIVARLMGTS